MLVRLLQRFSSIRLRQDAHPEAVAPVGVERSPYTVDGCERVCMRSHLTAYVKVGVGLGYVLRLGRTVLILASERTVGGDGGSCSGLGGRGHRSGSRPGLVCDLGLGLSVVQAQSGLGDIFHIPSFET